MRVYMTLALWNNWTLLDLRASPGDWIWHEIFALLLKALQEPCQNHVCLLAYLFLRLVLTAFMKQTSVRLWISPGASLNHPLQKNRPLQDHCRSYRQTSQSMKFSMQDCPWNLVGSAQLVVLKFFKTKMIYLLHACWLPPVCCNFKEKRQGKNDKKTKKTKNIKNYFTSSDPHRDIILKHICHKFWHSFCPSVSRFHQNYPLLLVPSPGSGSSSAHCDLSSQTDSNWLLLRFIQNNFRRLGVSRRPSAWKLRFETYNGGYVSLQVPRRLEFNRDRSIETVQ